MNDDRLQVFPGDLISVSTVHLMSDDVGLPYVDSSDGGGQVICVVIANPSHLPSWLEGKQSSRDIVLFSTYFGVCHLDNFAIRRSDIVTILGRAK